MQGVGKRKDVITLGLPEYNDDYKISFGQSHRTVVDKETNQELSLIVKTSLAYGEETYKRTYKAFFASCFRYADSAKTKVLFYIMSSLKYRQYKYVAQPEDIAAGAGVSRASVFTALRDMQAEDFIRKIQNGVWMINPDLISDLDELMRQRLVRDYYNLPNNFKE